MIDFFRSPARSPRATGNYPSPVNSTCELAVDVNICRRPVFRRLRTLNLIRHAGCSTRTATARCSAKAAPRCSSKPRNMPRRSGCPDPGTADGCGDHLRWLRRDQAGAQREERAGQTISRTVELAGLARADIDHVHAHANRNDTFGDLAAARAILLRAERRPHAGGVRAESRARSFVGCSRSVGGRADRAGTARVLTVQALRDGVVPPTLNLKISIHRSISMWWQNFPVAATTATPLRIPLASAGEQSRRSHRRALRGCSPRQRHPVTRSHK